MKAITVRIECFVDDHQPGFVECSLVDASGRKHRFIEKAPVVTDKPLGRDSIYPCDGTIACEIRGKAQKDDGSSLITVCTKTPWAVESDAGETSFTVYSHQVIEQ